MSPRAIESKIALPMQVAPTPPGDQQAAPGVWVKMAGAL